MPASPETAADLGASELSVVVPARNASGLLEDCLASIAHQRPREVIVVDGLSSDGTVDIARRYADTVLSDGGRGLPAARLLGAQAATGRWVALVDADVVVPDGALASLLSEFVDGGYVALQAGLHSVSTGEYWGEALAHHHRTGRSKRWFGLVATIFERDVLLDRGFDDRFTSGEDIELRWRLARRGDRTGVSTTTTVIHRFEDGFAFARGQWLADGRGLGRMARKHRGTGRGAALLALPLAAGVRGAALSLARREPRWLPYYACYAAYNYAGILAALREPVRQHGDGHPATA
jgi:glycosyltransferase involved in cell wall biosynthesis